MDSAIDVPTLKQITVANPGAGVDWRHTCPGIALRRIIALRALFTASAAAANRVPTLVLSDGSDDFAASGVATAITANQATAVSTFSGAPAAGLQTGAFTIAAPTDGWLLLPGWSLRAVTAALDAGDAWTAIRLWVVDYPTGPTWRLTPDVASFIEPKG